MSDKAKNIIAIVIAAVAILAVAAVVVLSSIVVRPTAYAGGWLDNVTAVEIYHSSAEGNLLHSGAIASELNEGTGEYADDGYTAGDLLDESGFSLIAACLQFNYSFGLSLADGDNAENNKMSRTEMSARHTELTTGAESARGYSVVIRLGGEPRSLELTDDHGRKVTQEYDTVMFNIDQDSDWVRNIEVYAFDWNGVFGENDDPATPSSDYYRMTLGMRTAGMLDILEGVYGYSAFPEDEEEEEDEDAEDTEGTDDTEGTEDTSDAAE